MNSPKFCNNKITSAFDTLELKQRYDLNQREREDAGSSGVYAGHSTGAVRFSDLVQAGGGSRDAVAPVPTTGNPWEESLLHIFIHSPVH